MDKMLWLSRRALVSVSGADARKFLQGLVTVEVNNLAAPRYAALLTPQGKFLHDFFIIPQEGGLWLDVEQSRAADLITRLTRYRLRADVTLAPVGNIAVFAGGNAGFIDPRFAALGHRSYGPPQPGMQPGDAEYDAHRLQLGVPEGADFIPERSFIVECGFERLNGVDFNKGCYVGQEVTARTKFKSVIRKGFYRVEGAAPLPAFGTKIMQGEKEAGELRSSQGALGMAMLYHEASGGALTCNGVPICATTPPWSKITGEAGATGV